MARTKQQLINYHTSSKTNMPSGSDVTYGELVVRHAEEKPELLIKVGENKFATFIASGAIETAINASNTELAGDISALEAKVDAVSATVKADYALSANTNAQITAATKDAKDYADAQDEALSGRINTYISQTIENNLTSLDGRLDTAEADITALKTFSGKVETDYATKTEVQTAKDAAVTSAYTNAKADVIGTSADNAEADTVYGAKAYASSLTHTLSGNVVAAIDEATSDVSDLSGSVVELSGAVVTMSADMKTYIDNELSTVYTYKTSVDDMEALNAIENPEVGDVYNVVAANGEPGDDDYTPAGTNYAWNGSEWDALGGTVDLSAYATNDALNYVSGRVETLQSADAAVKTALSAVSSTLFTVSASVVNDYALSANTAAEIGKAKVEAEIASSAYTDSQIQMLSGITSAYVASELTSVKSDVSNLKEFTANTAATHDEVATQSAATFNSAYTAAVASAESYTNTISGQVLTTIRGDVSESGNTLGAIEDRIDGIDGRLTTVEGNVSNLTASATNWNSMVAGSVTGGTLATVETASSTNWGAKMATEAQTIKLDLSELVIDCGDF